MYTSWATLDTKRYYAFINNIICTRGQWNNTIRFSKDGCSRHHIIPKAFHGKPNNLSWSHHENIIWLTHYEHLLAHKILAFDNQNNALACSGYIFFRKFCENNNLQIDNIKDDLVFNHIYHTAQSRKGSLNGMYDKKHSEETKQLMSKNYKKRVYTNDERLRISKRSSVARWYNNGSTEVFTQSPPDKYKVGRLPGTNVGGKNAAAIKCYVYDINKQLLDICECINYAGLKYGLKDREAKKHTGWQKGPYKGYYFIKEQDKL